MNIKDEYKRLRKNIQNKISYYKKKGILIDTKLPKIPKNISKKSIQALEKKTTQAMLSKAKYFNVETGEKITKKQYEKINSEASHAKKPRTRRNTISGVPVDEGFTPVDKQYKENFLLQIKQYSDPAQRIVEWWLNKQISSHGEQETWLAIQVATSSGTFLTEDELTSSDRQYEPLKSKLDEIARFMGLVGEVKEEFAPTTDLEGAQIYDSEGEMLL